MNKKLKINWMILALLFVLLISACTPGERTPSPAEETEIAGRMNLARTDAAITVVADITEYARLNPSPTATQTPLPPPTCTPPVPTQTPLPQPTNTVYVPPVVLFNTPTVSPTPSEYACSLVSKSPADGTTFAPGGDFDVKFVVKNTGTEDWDAGNVDYGFTSGDEFFTSDGSYDLDEDVDSGDELTIVLDAIAPDTEDEYTTTWAVRSGSKTYCSFSLTIKVE